MQDQALTITYVTDPDLDDVAQRRILQDFVACAREMPLRIAFRFPDATDVTVGKLVDWYLNLSGARHLLPPLIHARSELVRKYPDCQLWLPSRTLQADGAAATAYSVHSRDQAELAIARGATEVIYGHVFATASHPNESPRGIDALANIAAIAPNGTAIGGINEQTIGAIRTTGVHSVAVIRAVSRSPDIAVALRRMQQEWKGHTNG